MTNWSSANGGDTFDYAVDDTTARVAIFDAMGHGLSAGLLATVAVAAYRYARRTGRDLAETVTAVDAAIADTSPASDIDSRRCTKVKRSP